MVILSLLFFSELDDYDSEVYANGSGGEHRYQVPHLLQQQNQQNLQQGQQPRSPVDRFSSASVNANREFRQIHAQQVSFFKLLKNHYISLSD